ncbi:hypothetical protein PR048_019212 [Dryococelus australis]|uniref:SSD domain-containing protein n=1 Tax=Dryococelus australis TaxID=614101 RepID=A0ABQ9H2W4_9NEOP|nr:hypothetical protein PR048_019212 [Dryococelus australis]
MLAAWRRSSIKLDVPERMAQMLSEAAVSITITSFTDMISFFIGIISPFPSVRIFCAYSGFSVFFTFLWHITFFAACVAVAGYAEQKNLHSVACVKVQPVSCSDKRSWLYRIFCSGGINPDDPDNPLDNTEHGIMAFFRDTMASMINKWPVKVLIIAVFAAYLAGAGFGLTRIKEGLERRKLSRADSYSVEFYDREDYYFREFPYRIQVVISGEYDYSDPEIQQQVENLTQSFENTSFISSPLYTESWLRSFVGYIRRNQDYLNVTIDTEEDFIKTLKELWLFKPNPFSLDVKFNDNETKIIASRFLIQAVNISDSNGEKEMVRVLRKICHDSQLNVTVFHPYFVFFDQDFSSNEICACCDIGMRDSITSAPLDLKHLPVTAMDCAQCAQAECHVFKLPELALSAGVFVFQSSIALKKCAFELVRPTSIQSMIIGAFIMMMVCFIFIPNVSCCLWVAFSIISIETGVAGYMALWDVNLDSISMINLIMCIGFSVDFTAHICYAYMSSKALTPEQRVRESLYALGLPIVQGAFSTILAVVTLIFAGSYIFLVFFKMVFLVVFFGAMHGLFLLPVLLSLFGPGSCTRHPKENKDKKKEPSDVEKTFPHPFYIPHPSLHPSTTAFMYPGPNGETKSSPPFFDASRGYHASPPRFGIPLPGLPNHAAFNRGLKYSEGNGSTSMEKDLGIGTSGEDSSESSSNKSQRRLQREAEEEEEQRKKYEEGWRKTSAVAPVKLRGDFQPPHIMEVYNNSGYVSEDEDRAPHHTGKVWYRGEKRSNYHEDPPKRYSPQRRAHPKSQHRPHSRSAPGYVVEMKFP